MSSAGILRSAGMAMFTSGMDFVMVNRQSMSVDFRLIDFNRSIMMKSGFGNELGTHRVAIFWSTKVKLYLRDFLQKNRG